MPEYGYKKIPPFDPEHYQAWTSDAIRAFDEREWLPYLLGTNKPSSSATAEDLIKYDTGKKTPHAFLNASIPYAYKARVDDCEDAADLWEMLKQEFATFTASDEARLEALAYDFRKSAKDTIDEHTTKFVNLIAQITTHQTVKYTDAKINNLYLRSLELSSIPNEDWKPFVTSLGESYSLITRQTVYSKARSYYLQHMQTDKKSTVDTKTIDTKATIQEAVTKAFAAQFRGTDKGGDKSQGNKPSRHCFHCNRNGHTIDTCYQLNGYPPNTPFCSHCKHHGHSYDDCRSKNSQNGQLPSSGSGPPAREKSKLYRQATVARVYTASDHSPRTRDWFYDSGATDSMTWNPLWFQAYIDFEKPEAVHGIGEDAIFALGKGTVVMYDANKRPHEVHHVLYVPALRDSLISKHWTRLNGLTTTLDDEENVILSSSNGFTITTTSVNRLAMFEGVFVSEYNPLYEFETSLPQIESAKPELAGDPVSTARAQRTSTAEDILWHKRLGHASDDRVKALGIHLKVEDCHHCIIGKQARQPFKSLPDDHTVTKLYRVYADFCGKITPVSLGGNEYILTITDEKSKYTWSWALPYKPLETVLNVFIPWQRRVERQCGEKIKIFHTDGGKEFTGIFDDYFVQEGIKHDTTVPYSPESNRSAERQNRTLLTMIRPMMTTANLPRILWGETLATATYIRNRLPTRALDTMTPHEAWFGEKPQIKHLRTFGCVAYAHIPHEKTNKLDDRGKLCCFIGYNGNNQFRILNIDTGKVEIIHDIRFIEDKFLTHDQFTFITNKATETSGSITIENFRFEDDSDYESDTDERDIPRAPLPTPIPTPLPERLPYLPVERALQPPPPAILPRYPIPSVPIPQPTEPTPPPVDTETPPPVDAPPEPTLAPPTGRPQHEKFPSLKLQEQQQGLASARIAIGEVDNS